MTFLYNVPAACLWSFCVLEAFTNSFANEAVLMDTRTATSDVGWTKPPTSKFQEMTVSRNEEERRTLVVCEIRSTNQDNWVRTPFIPLEQAHRVYVEFEFTIRSCDDVENVAMCKETFNLYYYETDYDEATSTFPRWQEDPYHKVDTIAADARFRPGSEETNFETRTIGPLTKRGIYLAVQDTGACLAVMHLRVYYKYCRPTVQLLANFARAIAGPGVTSLVESKGTCVQHSTTENGVQPSLYCNGDGEWAVPTGTCQCSAGFHPDRLSTACIPCKPGYYKSNSRNRPCLRCPAYSLSSQPAQKVCGCMSGYFRAHHDPPDKPCTKPPSSPRNLRAVSNLTSITLRWDRPIYDGGRDDLTYRVRCMSCKSDFTACGECPVGVDFDPGQSGLVNTQVTVRHLHAAAFYKFEVRSENGVSGTANVTRPATVTAGTEQAAPSRVVDVRTSQPGPDSFLVYWSVPTRRNGRIVTYEVVVTSSPRRADVDQPVFTNRTCELWMKVTDLEPDTSYTVKVRARTSAGFGQFSSPSIARTLPAPDEGNKSLHVSGGSQLYPVDGLPPRSK